MKYILKVLKQKKLMPTSKELIKPKIIPKPIGEELIGKAIESKSPVVEDVLIGVEAPKVPTGAMDLKVRESLLKQYDEELGIIRNKLKNDAGKPSWDKSFNEYRKIMGKVNKVFDSK